MRRRSSSVTCPLRFFLLTFISLTGDGDCSPLFLVSFDFIVLDFLWAEIELLEGEFESEDSEPLLELSELEDSFSRTRFLLRAVLPIPSSYKLQLAKRFD